MARPEEVPISNRMKKAKTARDMIQSWATQAAGRDMQETLDGLRLYIEKKPEMIETFAHNALSQILDRGILDPKTRYLVLLGIYMALRHWPGISPQCCNAKASGCTDEEILEVAFLTNYAVSKSMMSESGITLSQVFESPMYQKIQKR